MFEDSAENWHHVVQHEQTAKHGSVVKLNKASQVSVVSRRVLCTNHNKKAPPLNDWSSPVLNCGYFICFNLLKFEDDIHDGNCNSVPVDKGL
jgi:hypothetical protein